jgi:hypothetical protein
VYGYCGRSLPEGQDHGGASSYRIAHPPSWGLVTRLGKGNSRSNKTISYIASLKRVSY